METQLFDFFGVPAETVLIISGLVWVVVELIKGKFPSGAIYGWRTDVIAIIVAIGLSLKALWPNWPMAMVCGVLCWLIPAGVHQRTKPTSK